MKKIISILLLLLFASVNLKAQKDNNASIPIDTLGKKKKVQLLGLPVIFYTPETQFGFGGGLQIFLLEKSNIYNDRVTNIFIDGIFTTNNQFILDVKPQIYFLDGNYYLDVAYKFKIFPNSFWGIGSFTPNSNLESYNMTSHQLSAAFLKRMPPYLNFGFEFVYEYHDVTEVEEDGLLDSGTIPGSDFAVISGLNVVFNFDSRSTIEAPQNGHFLQIKAGFSSENFGANYGYNKFLVDLRTYQKIGKKSIIAAQIFSENNYGLTPFQGQAWYGGGDRARGYFRGRFIDNHMIVIQAEYRWRFKPRWTVAGFILAGDVADQPSSIFQDVKPSFGGGIRFKITKTQNTLIRLDVGFGKDGSNGIYFGINEAF